MNGPRAPDPRSPDAGQVGEAGSIQRELARLRDEQDRIFRRMQSSEQHFRKLARSVWRVQEDERRRIARDLHDGVGQNLTALKHRLDAFAADAGLADATRASAQQALDLCATALDEVRALSRALRPQVLDDLGLEPALNWLARSLRQPGGAELEVDLATLPSGLDGETETLVFRIVQEALTNALKHAGARHVLVRVARRGPLLQVMVVDDGAGCDPDAALAAGSQGQSTGLSSMRERVRLFGGQFQFQSAPGEGAQLRIAIPIEAPASGTGA